jgi:uncharacterized protein YraI
MKTYKLLVVLIIVTLALQACNLPEVGVVPPPQGAGEDPSLLMTITAQALILEQAKWTATPIVAQNQVVVVVTATADGAASATPDAALPPAPANAAPPSGAPTVTVSIATNCRTGPGQAYPAIFGLPVGQPAEVVGKNTSTNYWIIKIPNGAGTCWLWGQYATVTGDTSALPTVAIPPTPTPTITPTPKVTVTPTSTTALAPAAPSNLSEQNTCTLNPDTTGFKYITNGTVNWQDNSSNEKGFNVYWNSNFSGSKYILIGTVGPNTTSLGFSMPTYADFKSTVKVEAFNDTGKSESTPVNIVLNCPP